MNELHDLLERATDRIESPDLAAGALAGARRRRTTRRSVLAAGVAAMLVVVVALVGQLTRGDGDSAPPPVTPPKDLTQPRWDPRDVDDLPAAAAAVAPGLPDVVEAPASAPALAGRPMDAAVLSVDARDALLLLGTDGSWRSVAPPSEYGGADLTRDGTRLAVETEDGVDVWDLPAGRRAHLPVPEGFRDWDYTSWRWLDHDTLLLDDLNPGGWRIDAHTGAAERVPYPSMEIGSAIDPNGAVLESRDYSRAPQLTDWAGGEPRRLDLTDIGRLTSLQADAATVVGTAYQHGPFSVFVVDRDDLRVGARLPLGDHDGNYSNGGLTLPALLGDGTVLMRVAVFDDEMSWRLVAWDPNSGDLSLVTHGVGTVTSFAVDVIG